MFIFEPDPDLIAEMETDDTNVIAFPKKAEKVELPCDVEPTDDNAA